METFLSKNFKNRTLCNALLDLVTFLQFRKREKRQWKTNGITLFHGSFSRFLNCTNGTKPRKASHMQNMVTFFNPYLLKFDLVCLNFVNVDNFTSLKQF